MTGNRLECDLDALEWIVDTQCECEKWRGGSGGMWLLGGGCSIEWVQTNENFSSKQKG